MWRPRHWTTHWLARYPPDILGDVEVKALVDTLVETLPHVKAKKVCDTLGDVEPKALVATLADTLGHSQWAMCRVRH